MVLGVRDVIQAISRPDFAVKVPYFDRARQAAWDLYNQLVAEGMIHQNGKPKKGCAGCRGGQLMRRYRQVYRVFMMCCVEIKEDPEAVEALKAYFNVMRLTVVDPDTGEHIRL